MSIGDTTLTVVGNLTADPELRWLTGGAAVASFTVAASRRVYDQQSGAWKDADTLFMRCVAWRFVAEHVGETLTRGMRVIATGRLKQRDYEANDGAKRTVVELEVEEIGPSLKYATATVKKAARSGGDNVPHPADAWAKNNDDAWSTPPAAESAPVGAEPPF